MKNRERVFPLERVLLDHAAKEFTLHAVKDETTRKSEASLQQTHATLRRASRAIIMTVSCSPLLPKRDLWHSFGFAAALLLSLLFLCGATSTENHEPAASRASLGKAIMVPAAGPELVCPVSKVQATATDLQRTRIEHALNLQRAGKGAATNIQQHYNEHALNTHRRCIELATKPQ